MTLSKRLKLLVVLCIMLTVILALALYGQRKDMRQSYTKINQLIEVQLTIDLVRANLWLLQQFQDQKAVAETRSAVERLQRIIDITATMPLNEYEKRLLHNIRRHQHNITLLLQLSASKSDGQTEVSAEATSNAALTARYNTIVQSLSEDSLRFQQITIRNSLESESKHLFLNASLILVIALTVTLFSLHTLNSFKRKFGTLKQGIQALAQGDLSSRLSMPPGDEFAELSDAFNQMKHELMQTMQRRDELQQEVEEQTKQLVQQQEKLRQMAEYDDLTGIYNRGAAQNYIAISLERCKRQQTQAAVLFIDLDDFKPINDQFGHKIGDIVLKELANRMMHSLRASDIIARLGGDEFIIWLDPLKDDEQIATVTEKLSRLGHDIYIEELQQMLDVNLSIGASVYPQHGNNLTELITHADQQMYQQKKINKQQNRLNRPSEESTPTKKGSPLVYVDFRTDK